MSEESEEELEKKFPSVELVYPLAVASYDLAQKRLDVVEGRLQTLLAFVPPVTIAVIAAARSVPFASWWFVAAMVSCLFGLAGGGSSRLAHKITGGDPSGVFGKRLHFFHGPFERNVIFFS